MWSDVFQSATGPSPPFTDTTICVLPAACSVPHTVWLLSWYSVLQAIRYILQAVVPPSWNVHMETLFPV
jgi:hypothetical protein